MKTHTKNTCDSLSPLTWLLKLFVMNSNVNIEETYSKTRYIVKAVFVLILLSALNVCSLYLKMMYVYNMIINSIRITDAVQTIYDQCQYAVDLWFIYKYGRHISVEYFKQYERVDNNVGMTYFSEVKKKLLRIVITFIIIWLTTSAIDFVAWIISFGVLIPSMYCVSYIFLLIKIATTLDMTSHVIQIEVRLRIIGDIIENYYTKTEVSSGNDTERIGCRNWQQKGRPSTPLRITINFIRNDCVGDGEIKLLNKCYFLLNNQVEFINQMFGLRILLNSLSLLIDMVRFINIAVRLMIGSQQTLYYSGYFPVVANIIRFLTCVLVLISLVYHCENCYQEKERILKTIDLLLVYKNPDEKQRAAMSDLRQLVQDRPIVFNMSNFIILNNGLLLSIASVVTTYTIILLQST